MVETLAKHSDFVLKIFWAGPEDKPFYRAAFSSDSSSVPSYSRPFYACATINRSEFQKLLEVLEDDGWNLRPSRYVSSGKSEYYVQVEDAGKIFHVPLGFSVKTLASLKNMEDCLQKTSRPPLSRLVARLQPLLILPP